MLAQMPLPLFFEWMDYFEVEPFGEERGDLRTAIVAQVIASTNAKPGKRFKVTEFMPQFEKHEGGARRPPQTTEQMQATFMSFVEAQNKLMQGSKNNIPRKPK